VGKVISTNKKTITFENNYVGYSIYVPNPTEFEINKVIKLYIYKNMCVNNKNKINEEIYGFINYQTKDLFLTLINVNGIGPKIANQICANDINLIKQFVSEKNIESLCLLEGISPKIAKSLCDELEGVFAKNNDNISYRQETNELISALKHLGYSQSEIELAIRKTNFSKTNNLSDLISEAIKIIATGNKNDSFTDAKTN
jgi:Holliday junction DNA helicase RuvA